MVADLGNYAKSLGATILIVDPITPLLLPANPATPVQVHARALIQLIQTQLNMTTLFTSHASRVRDPDAVHIEQFLAIRRVGFKRPANRTAIASARSISRRCATRRLLPASTAFTMVNNQGIVLLESSSNGASGASPVEPPRPSESQFFQSFKLEDKDS